MHSLVGKLGVKDDAPAVFTEDGNAYSLSSCKLTKHSYGHWLFNMNLSGVYSSFKEGTRVVGFANGNKFHAHSLFNFFNE